jgi:hypothetical protein
LAQEPDELLDGHLRQLRGPRERARDAMGQEPLVERERQDCWTTVFRVHGHAFVLCVA